MMIKMKTGEQQHLCINEKDVYILAIGADGKPIVYRVGSYNQTYKRIEKDY